MSMAGGVGLRSSRQARSRKTSGKFIHRRKNWTSILSRDTGERAGTVGADFAWGALGKDGVVFFSRGKRKGRSYVARVVIEPTAAKKAFPPLLLPPPALHVRGSTVQSAVACRAHREDYDLDEPDRSLRLTSPSPLECPRRLLVVSRAVGGGRRSPIHYNRSPLPYLPVCPPKDIAKHDPTAIKSFPWVSEASCSSPAQDNEPTHATHPFENARNESSPAFEESHAFAHEDTFLKTNSPCQCPSIPGLRCYCHMLSVGFPRNDLFLTLIAFVLPPPPPRMNTPGDGLGTPRGKHQPRPLVI